HSAARPKVSGKTAFFPRNDRPYGLKCKAFQTENALERFNFEKGEGRLYRRPEFFPFFSTVMVCLSSGRHADFESRLFRGILLRIRTAIPFLFSFVICRSCGRCMTFSFP
ncbi:hypothetical protein, partial [uncultured Desulfovibrio sp.]|uniref:hypothetical protein n=1 Tax=uncultured Desulfovibrio sp. TaxID=167968 RepID=UPI002615E7F2